MLAATFRSASVDMLAECVASMDADQLDEVNRVLGVVPVRLCGAGLAWCRRPRLFWCTWELVEAPGVGLTEGSQFHKVSLAGQRPPPVEPGPRRGGGRQGAQVQCSARWCALAPAPLPGLRLGVWSVLIRTLSSGGRMTATPTHRTSTRRRTSWPKARS